MKIILTISCYMAVAFALVVPLQAKTERPNVVVILADDLGYSDLGCYGSQIETPNLDQLARNGLQFTRFCNTARCWPTRAALLTGYYAQQVRRDKLPGIRPSGGGGKRPEWARLLPEMLAQVGYRAYHSGKWHLDGTPMKTGFDHSYRMADHGRFFNPMNHFKDDKKLPPVEPGTDYYVTDAIADYAINSLADHATAYAENPFFLYLAFTSPHFPLHAKPRDIARYREIYQTGWDNIRQSRWARIEQLGLVEAPLSEVEREVGPPYHFPKALKILGSGEVNRPLSWNDLTEQQKEFQAMKMAIHAAMIDSMDQNIGRVVDQLRAMDVLDNTLIFFLSDNGASAEIMVRDDGHDPQAEPGSAATYLCLGPGWSTTANTPFRRHKTWVHEGGISTPLIVHWPKGITARGELRHNRGHVIDLVPTILEVTGTDRFKSYNGKPVPTPPGHSLVPAWTDRAAIIHESLWWSHEGNRAIQVKEWKLVAAGAEGPWELYDLSNDRTETNNLAGTHPAMVRRLQQAWTKKQNEFVTLVKGGGEQRVEERQTPAK